MTKKFQSARISSNLLLDDLGVNSNRTEAPVKPNTVPSHGSNAVAEVVKTFARLLNLKPAPLIANRVRKPTRES